MGENVITKTDKTTEKVLKMCHGGASGSEANANRRQIEQKCGSGGERVRSKGVSGMVRGEKRAVFGTVREEKQAVFGSGERAERGGDGRGGVGATFFFFFCVSLLQSLFENDILIK